MPSKPLPPTSSGKSHLLSPHLLVQQVDHSSWLRHPKASPQKCSSCDMGSHRKNMSWDRTTPKGLKNHGGIDATMRIFSLQNQTSTTSALENAEKQLEISMLHLLPSHSFWHCFLFRSSWSHFHTTFLCFQDCMACTLEEPQWNIFN